MKPPNHLAEEIVDAFVAEQKRHHAFADALVELFRRYPLPAAELFRRYPLPGHAHDMHRAVRRSALRKARKGGYAEPTPGGMSYWRRQVMENAREDWGVPDEEVLTIHALIYG